MANIYKMDNDYLSAESVYDRTTGKTQSELNGTFVRPNLLDNWYFVGGGSQLGDGVFPINQRGQSSYSQQGYRIDRWRLDGYVNLTLNTNYINLTKTQSDSYRGMSQPIKVTGITGRTVTLSMLCSSTQTGQIRFSVIDGNGNQIMDQYPYITVANTQVLVQYTFVATSDDLVVYIRPGALTSLNVYAVKLELGDTQTLAHQESGAWVLNEIPDYGEQLARCQRIFERLKGYVYTLGSGFIQSSTTARVNIPTKVTKPNATVTVSGTIHTAWAGHSGSQSTPSTTVSETSFYGGNALLVMGGMTGLTTGQGCFMQIRDSTSYVDISAET